MRTTLHVVITTILALALHLVLGWTWTIVAGMAGGAWMGRGGWLVGGLGVGLDWAGLVLYNYAVAGEATQAMTETMGGLLGNTPSFVIVAATVLIGILIGVLGGALGTALRGLIRSDPAAA